MSACGGQCCAAFTMSVDVEEFACEGGSRSGDDEEYIADMVIEILAGEALLRKIAFGANEEWAPGLRYYKCRHWDEGTRLCKAYGSRPSMCRSFPQYGDDKRTCPHGCGEGGCGA